MRRRVKKRISPFHRGRKVDGRRSACAKSVESFLLRLSVIVLILTGVSAGSFAQNVPQIPRLPPASLPDNPSGRLLPSEQPKTMAPLPDDPCDKPSVLPNTT